MDQVELETALKHDNKRRDLEAGRVAPAEAPPTPAPLTEFKSSTRSFTDRDDTYFETWVELLGEKGRGTSRSPTKALAFALENLAGTLLRKAEQESFRG